MKRFADAIGPLHCAHAENPQNIKPLILIAWCYGEWGRPNEGIDAAEKALTIDPENINALQAYAYCWYVTQNYDRARESIRAILQLDPQNAYAHYLEAHALTRKAKFKQALASIDEALRLDPEGYGAQTLRSQLLSILGKKSAAKNASLEALRIDPEAVQSHIQFGRLLRRSGNASGSIESLLEALRCDPSNTDAKKELIIATRSRFFLYRWHAAYEFWMLRFPRFVFPLIVLSPIIAIIGTVGLAQSSKIFEKIWFVFLAAFIINTFGRILLPAHLDGIMAFDPKYHFVLLRRQRFLAKASVVSFAFGLLTCLLAARLHEPMVTVFATAVVLVWLAICGLYLWLPSA